jgi:GDPmannose 4,6-dehydratase
MTMAGTVLITGVTGQDGTYLSRTLTDLGQHVHGVLRPGDSAGDNPATMHESDLRDGNDLRRLVNTLRPDVIYNLGGQTSVAASWDDPLDTIAATGAPVAVLLDAAWHLHEEGHPTRLVQASSAEMFGNSTESPQNENTPIAPVSPYGAAKALAHFLVGSYRQRGLHASSVILYNHESPLRPDTFVTRKITRAAARISRGLQDRLELGGLDMRRDWGWAPDYVDALRRVAEQQYPGDYVIGTGQTHSVADFVAAAFAAVGIDDWRPLVRIDAALKRPADPTEQRADSRKAREQLGWQPTVSFDDMVRRMVEADLAALDSGAH